MAASYSQFVVEFPEFLGVDSALVTAKLNASVLEVDVGACGTLSDQLTYYLTAQKLAKMPSGNTSKLVNKDGSTVYDSQIESLAIKAVGGGPRTP